MTSSSSVAPVQTLTTPAHPAGYGAFLVEIKTQIRQRQYQALHAVNRELLALYWWLGENISQRQVALGWGKSVVENLARDLQAEFPGRNGFSSQNLWFMRQFFNSYSDKPKLQPLVREISWAKNLVIMARCKDDLEREFYLRATARFGWTKSVLQHQIDNNSYAQYLNGQTNFDAALPESIKAQALLPTTCPTQSRLRRVCKRGLVVMMMKIPISSIQTIHKPHPHRPKPPYQPLQRPKQPQIQHQISL